MTSNELLTPNIQTTPSANQSDEFLTENRHLTENQASANHAGNDQSMFVDNQLPASLGSVEPEITQPLTSNDMNLSSSRIPVTFRLSLSASSAGAHSCRGSVGRPSPFSTPDPSPALATPRCRSLGHQVQNPCQNTQATGIQTWTMTTMTATTNPSTASNPQKATVGQKETLKIQSDTL